MAQEVVGTEAQGAIGYRLHSIPADYTLSEEARWDAEENVLTMVTVSGIGEAVRTSPGSDSKWTSFDDSEADGDENSSRHNSESEHQNLLADVDVASDVGDDTTTLTGSVLVEEEDPSLVITPQLRSYYENCFEKLRQDILNSHARELAKNQSSTAHKSSSPVSSPVDIGPAATSTAVWGKHPRVKEFFERSNLDKKELSQIWELADVNKDGWLNTAEFCVAMHLIVRRIQGGIAVPSLLPIHVRPPVTTPVMSPPPGPSDVNWTHFDSLSDQHKPAVSAATTSDPQPSVFTGVIPATVMATIKPADRRDSVSALSSPPDGLKDFTNVPPNPDPGSHSAVVVQPKARRVTPEFNKDQRSAVPHQQYTSSTTTAMVMSHHSLSAPPTASKFVSASVITPRPRTSTNDSTPITTKVQTDTVRVTSAIQAGPLPAAVPKGPPPKPPPRPTPTGPGGHRHSRSVSLDLSKQINENQHQFTTAKTNSQTMPRQEPTSQTPISGSHDPGQQFPAASSSVKKELKHAQVQTVVTWNEQQGSGTMRQLMAPMLDLSMDEAACDPGPMKPPPSFNQQSSLGPGAGDGGGDVVPTGDTKDWTKRCDRLRRMNADLERELKKMSEVRVGLEMHLKRLEKL